MGQVCYANPVVEALREAYRCGLCSATGADEDRTLLAMVMQVNSESPTFPGSQASIVRGMCVSGGGARAFTFAAGVFRGLHELGLFPRLDAISSVSGGSWASGAFMFATKYHGSKVDTTELLGAATSPGKLTMPVLSQPPAPLGANITVPTAPIMLRVAKSVPPGQIWTTFVGEWILRPFGLSSMDAFMAATPVIKARIIRDNPALADKTFFMPRADRPKNLIINGDWLAPVGYFAGPEATVALQMSPDYTGSPFYPNNEMVTYQSAYHPLRNAALLACCPPVVSVPSVLCDCCCKSCGYCGTTLRVGGGMVETFAFGGKQPVPACQSGGKVEVGYPCPQPLSLSKAIGISSMAPALGLNAFAGIGRLANPKITAWPVTSSILPGPQSARKYEVGDGGCLDNSGLLALLQRGARQVVWVASSFRGLSYTYNYAAATPETFDPNEAGVIDSVFGKFGYGEDVFGFYYGQNQVFQKGLLLDLVRELVALRDAGRPAVVQRSYAVLPNAWWGIQGGYMVDVLLVYLERVRDFEKDLPVDTQRQIARGEGGPFADFPIYRTIGQNAGELFALTACQVNLLAAQAEYSVAQNRGLFKKLLS